MKPDKKISVIIPIYNSERFLLQTLNSVRFQNYENLDIVCVLDCPTDNSAKIVKEVAKEDDRIKVVEHSKNMGLSATRNSGAENATGAYIHFMDSDDLLSPIFYEIMVNAAVENDADVSACSVFNEKKPKQSIWFENDVIFGKDKIKKSEVLFRGWIWRYLIKKDFWDKHRLSFPTNLALMEDIGVSISMIYHANKIAVCSDVIYFYKNRENSMLNANADLSKEQKKTRRKNVSKAKKALKNVLQALKIKHPSRWSRFKERISGKFICENNLTEYEKSDKKISVIIPIYNAEKYLKQTLDFVRFQTYRNLEIVCVLDCPTDSSAEIVQEIAKEDHRIKIVDLPQNLGLPEARNSGVEHATGEYIHFMDADDLLSPDFYDILISTAENSDADVVACSVFYEKKPKKSIWFQRSEILSDIKDKIQKTEVAIQGWAWRYLIKKSFWDEHNFSFPDLVPMEDKPVMIPMIYYANKVTLCPSAVYFYKNRESSILNQKYDPIREKKRSENRQKARKIFKDFMKKHNIKRPNKLLYYAKKFLG